MAQKGMDTVDNRDLGNGPTCNKVYKNRIRIELEEKALSIIKALSDEQLIRIMEEMK